MSVDVKWYGREVFTLATKANVRAMEQSAGLVERYAKAIMGTGASRPDVKFRRQGKGKSKKKAYHRPSAPGFPPNIDTNNLRASITHVVTNDGINVKGAVGSDKEVIQARAEAGTDANYGFYLEVGTSRMAARPWLRPSLLKAESEILAFFKRANS